MILESKYDIGEKILVKADKKIKKKCPFCNGKGFKIVEGKQLYCLNCDDGILEARDSKVNEIVEGTIRQITYSVSNDIDAEFDDVEGYTKIEGDVTHIIDYFVELDDEENYYGYGKYKERLIIEKNKIK